MELWKTRKLWNYGNHTYNYDQATAQNQRLKLTRTDIVIGSR